MHRLAAILIAGLATVLTALQPAAAPTVVAVELQPLAAQVTRLLEALKYLGAPLPESDRLAIQAAIAAPDERAATSRIQETLDRHCAGVVGDRRRPCGWTA